MCYSFWWTVGSFFSYIALQTMAKTKPYHWLEPIYTQWAQIGIMLAIYLVLPESPAWCVTANKIDRAKAELRKLNGQVPGYDIDHQVQLLVLAVEHERDVAAEQRREHWTAIFRGTDGMRTLISLWTNMSQQFIGLTLFGTFGAYFFQQAGLDDPFKIKCITSSLNIATVLLTVLVADRWGRRWIACTGTTMCWAACVCIGILGVANKVKATDYLFVFFACCWSTSYREQPSVAYADKRDRYRTDSQRCCRLGLYRRDLVATSSTIHSRVWCRMHMRCWRRNECACAVHD